MSKVQTHTKEFVCEQWETLWVVEADQHDCQVCFTIHEKLPDGSLYEQGTGTINWDGCSVWNFPRGIRFYNQEAFQELSKLLSDLWSWAKELLGDNWDDPHACASFN